MNGRIGSLDWADCDECAHYKETGCDVSGIIDLREDGDFVYCEDFEEKEEEVEIVENEDKVLEGQERLPL